MDRQLISLVFVGQHGLSRGSDTEEDQDECSCITSLTQWASHQLVVDNVCLPNVSAKNCLHKLHLVLLAVMMLSCVETLSW